MIPIQHVQEDLSYSYASVLAARAGVKFRVFEPEYGIDALINSVKNVNGKRHDTGWGFFCQFKSTINWKLEEKHVIFDMEASAYNKLIDWEGGLPCLLILFCLPKNSSDWIEYDEERLILRRSCYWAEIKGERTTNKYKTRVRIPRSQLLTPESIIEIIERVKRGEL